MAIRTANNLFIRARRRNLGNSPQSILYGVLSVLPPSGGDLLVGLFWSSSIRPSFAGLRRWWFEPQVLKPLIADPHRPGTYYHE